MPAYYLDTSALVKRSIVEAGSAWVRQVADPSRRNGLDTSRLTAVELTAAVVRRARGAGIPSAHLQATLAAFHGDWSTEYRVIEVTVALVDRAVALAEQYAVRGNDAMHVATALAVNDITIDQGQPALNFVSADREQTAAATAAGLVSIDPTTMP